MLSDSTTLGIGSEPQDLSCRSACARGAECPSRSHQSRGCTHAQMETQLNIFSSGVLEVGSPRHGRLCIQQPQMRTVLFLEQDRTHAPGSQSFVPLDGTAPLHVFPHTITDESNSKSTEGMALRDPNCSVVVRSSLVPNTTRLDMKEIPQVSTGSGPAAGSEGTVLFHDVPHLKLTAWKLP